MSKVCSQEYSQATRATVARLGENEMLRTLLHELSLCIKQLRSGQIGQFLSKCIEPPLIDAMIEAQVLLVISKTLHRGRHHDPQD